MRQGLLCLSWLVVAASLVFAGDDPEKVKKASPSPLEILLLKAASAGPKDYPRLRQSFLASSHIQALRKKVGTLSDWKQRAIAEAWLIWVDEPAKCRVLWSYSPPRNQRANPFPAMARASYRSFKDQGKTGLALARELMASKGEILYGGLPDLLAEDDSSLSRRIILELALKNNRMLKALRTLGKETAADLDSRLGDADSSCLPGLIEVLTEFGYKKSMPKLGVYLLALKKEGYNSWFKFHYYYRSDLGLAIARAFEVFAGAKFPMGGGGDKNAARIDAAKAWWKLHAKNFPTRTEKK